MSDFKNSFAIPDLVTRNVLESVHVADLPYATCVLLERLSDYGGRDFATVAERLDDEVREELMRALAMYDTKGTQEIVSEVALFKANQPALPPTTPAESVTTTNHTAL